MGEEMRQRVEGKGRMRQNDSEDSGLDGMLGYGFW